MDSMKRIMTLSFNYAPCLSHQYKPAQEERALTDLRRLCQKIMKTRQCDIFITNVNTLSDYILTLTGPLHSLVSARSDLLLHCPLKVELDLQVPANESPCQEECDRIANETETTIRITLPKPHQSCFVSDYITTLTLIGVPKDVEICRVKILVLLDEKVGLRSERVQIPLKYQYLIGGRKRTGLYPIIEETCTNIYFSSPITIVDDEPAINITGEATQVARAKNMLYKLASQKAKSMYHKSVKLTAQKLDWMLLHCKDDIRKIMHDNGSFVEFSPIGSGNETISVYAETRVNAERTLRALFLVSCSICEALFYFNIIPIHTISSLVTQLVQISGAHVTYQTGYIQVLGTERAIRNIYQRLQEISHLTPHNTLFRVESATDQLDFISGKKNGKISKIMKTSGATIRFLPPNDYTFLIEVNSPDFCKALDGWTLLQEELPAEISFFVPEIYHKRIIGVGGKNIQRIMKKYGVYVKFSNTEEFASLGGYYDNQDNVVARTPMKNQINLDNLRFAVMQLVQPNHHVTRTLRIPYRSHRFRSIELESVAIYWPECELATDQVVLMGHRMDQVEAQVWAVIPRVYRLAAPRSDALTALLDDLTSRMELEYGLRLEPYSDHANTIMILRPITCMTTFSRALDFLTSTLKAHSIVTYEHTCPLTDVRSTSDKTTSWKKGELKDIEVSVETKPTKETNLRAIFDADLTLQEKEMLNKSRGIWSYVPDSLSPGSGGFFAQDSLVQSMLENISLADQL